MNEAYSPSCNFSCDAFLPNSQNANEGVKKLRLSIMQPYFMPYLGYFNLIAHSDAMVLLDEVQFIYHGWIERNRILKPGGGWQYISVPLKKHSNRALIKTILIDNTKDWQRKIIAQLSHYKKARHYTQVIALLEKIFSASYNTITELNKASITEICSYIGLQKVLMVYSEMGLRIDSVLAPDEWALRICQAIPGANEYLNASGGREFFHSDKYREAGIRLLFAEPGLPPYRQKGGEFISGLSIIDALMFNSPEDVLEMTQNAAISEERLCAG